MILNTVRHEHFEVKMVDRIFRIQFESTLTKLNAKFALPSSVKTLCLRCKLDLNFGLTILSIEN